MTRRKHCPYSSGWHTRRVSCRLALRPHRLRAPCLAQKSMSVRSGSHRTTQLPRTLASVAHVWPRMASIASSPVSPACNVGARSSRQNVAYEDGPAPERRPKLHHVVAPAPSPAPPTCRVGFRAPRRARLPVAAAKQWGKPDSMMSTPKRFELPGHTDFFRHGHGESGDCSPSPASWV